MRRRLIVRRDVPGDLKNSIHYLSSIAAGLGRRFAIGYRTALIELRQHPNRGSIKVIPEIKGEVRSWQIPGFEAHLVLDRVHAEAVVVLGVLHGARDIGAILKSREESEK
jgi:hypothetical protein